MENTLLFATLAIGIVIGALMLVVVVVVYAKEHAFGLGGSVLSLIGVLLLGLSLWKSVEISVTAEGGFQAKFQAIEKKIEKEAKEASERINTLTKATGWAVPGKKYDAVVEIDNALPDGIGAVCATSRLLYQNLFVMSSNQNRAISLEASRQFACENPDSPVERLRVNEQDAANLYGTVPVTPSTSAIVAIVR